MVQARGVHHSARVGLKRTFMEWSRVEQAHWLRGGANVSVLDQTSRRAVFDDEDLSCTEELKDLLPAMIKAHGSEVALRALAMYLGLVLRLSVKAKVCTPEVVESMLQLAIEAASPPTGAPMLVVEIPVQH